ncbi:MAG TPA: glycosyltransferase family 4 protein [Thermoanaerobaculia bacterium]|nr:glycosyltransferase family 4 protein [Thermoanaerobaculia bacterium]
MKALLVTDDYPPDVGGIAAYLRDVHGDHEVLVVRKGWAWLQRIASTLRRIRRARPDMLFAGTLLPSGLIVRLASRMLRIPYAVHVYGTDLTTTRRSRLMQRVARAVLRDAARVIVISDFGATEALRRGVEASRIVKIVPPVDSETFRPAQRRDHTPTLLPVARLIPRKGHDVVLRALPRVIAAIGDVRYVIVGDGPERARLEALARELGVPAQFAGRVQDTVPYFQDCDVFVMMSRSEEEGEVEGFGIAFAEASACGKPVIGGRSGGTAEAVLDGLTGLLIDPHDVGALAQAIVNLLTDREQAELMGARGREFVERELSIASARERVDELLGPSILYPTELSFLRAGSQESLQELLATRDLTFCRRIVVCPPGDDYVDALARIGVRAYVAGAHPRQWRFSASRPLAALRDIAGAVRVTRRVVERENVRLIHVNSLIAAIAAVAAKRRRPSLRIVLHERGLAYRAHTRWLFRRVTRAVDRVIATTETGRRLLESWGVAPEKIAIIPNGTDFHHRASHASRDGGARVIGMVANFVRVKRHELFLDVLARLLADGENVRGVIAGGVLPIHDGAAYEAEVRAYAEKLGLKDRLLFTGFCDDVPALMAGMDVVMCTSRHESFCRVIIEAMAVGTPVVATAVGGVVDVIDDGRTGLLAHDADGLVSAVKRVLHEEGLAQRLREAALEEVRTRFDAARVTRRIEDLYRELLA